MAMDTFAFRKQWRMTKARIQATWFWRVFGIRAMQKGWTKFLVAVAIMAGFWSVFFYVELLREFNFEVRHSPMPPDGTLRIP
ncbi:MAG: hypothetical protein E7L31_17880 [Aeromonas sp.]|nr:hypothetical protein [Aeromonas sp.]